MTGTGALATAINGNKWRHRMKTSALGDSGADASLSLDSESNTSFIRSGFPGVCVCVCRCVFGFGFCFSFSSGSCFFRFGIWKSWSWTGALTEGSLPTRKRPIPGLGKSGPRLWFLGRMPTYAMYDSSDSSYANSVGDLTYSASETMYLNAYLSIPIHHPSRDLRNYSASHPGL